MVRASAALHDGRLYVPLTGTETVSGVNPDYECCRSRGGVAAVDANTGQVFWKVDTIPEPLRRIGENANGTPQWGPSGASVWNTPTIDPKRRRVYVGTGNNFGPFASDTSDAVLALGIDDGHIVWSHQEFKSDSFMLGCPDTSPARGSNCPEKIGPDWDFGGGSVILQTLPNGRDVLVAAGKGGIAIAPLAQKPPGPGGPPDGVDVRPSASGQCFPARLRKLPHRRRCDHRGPRRAVDSRVSGRAAGKDLPGDYLRLDGRTCRHTLRLKWAFGLPGGGVTASQPTVALGRVFIGSDNRVVYSLDARSGCAYWAFQAESPGRFAPILAPISGHQGTRYGVFFVTTPGVAHAIDAQDGTLLWKTEFKGMHAVNASSTYHDGRLYVPLAGTETFAGGNPNYACCRSRGGVVSLDANTGRIAWKVDNITEPVKEIGKKADGKPIWGLAGASVWNAPTVDPKRHVVYVGTGNAYGPIAADTSDSILALSMDDGRLVWHHQEFKNDSLMLGCGRTSPEGGNCPATLGPDWDFGGASIMLQTLPGGGDVLVAAGKGGIAIALDPDKQGQVLWRTTLFEGAPPSALGLVLFGGTADGTRANFPLQQPGGGLVAVRIADGTIEWRANVDADRRGQSGAATSIPGVVFTGGWDGILRAVNANGRAIWAFNAAQTFQSVNGVPAKGGSLAVTGPAIVDGMLYLGAGYIGVQNGTPGNVLLAFSVQ